jgi:hypothetical protein
VELRVDPPATVMVMRQRQPLDRVATRGFPLARLTAVRAHGRSTIDQHLGRAQIRTGRFIDQLLGTGSHLVISRRSPSMVMTTLSLSGLDRQCRQVPRARSARVGGLAVLESAVHRGLAAIDLVIALVLAILFPDVGRSHLLFMPPGAGDPAGALAHREVPHHITRPCAIVN